MPTAGRSWLTPGGNEGRFAGQEGSGVDALQCVPLIAGERTKRSVDAKRRLVGAWAEQSPAVPN